VALPEHVPLLHDVEPSRDADLPAGPVTDCCELHVPPEHEPPPLRLTELPYFPVVLPDRV
jgi:hypothetical protein